MTTLPNTAFTEMIHLKMSPSMLHLLHQRRQLCAAYCSIAELYLTDLCDEPDAETSCEDALKSALVLDEISSDVYSNAVSTGIGEDDIQLEPPPPEALQTMANLRLSQSRPAEALEFILKTYDRMKVGCEAMSALVGLSKDGENNDEMGTEAKAQELVEVDAAASLPGYEFRCQTAKILLECASSLEDEKNKVTTKSQCVEAAIHVLGSLLAENDEVIEVWYLLGCAFMAFSPPNEDSAHYYWDTALTMLNKVKEQLENLIEVDDDGYSASQLEAVECQIAEVKTKLGEFEGKKEE